MLQNTIFLSDYQYVRFNMNIYKRIFERKNSLFPLKNINFMGRIDPVEYVSVSQQRHGNMRNINHPLCGFHDRTNLQVPSSAFV